jgi:hypothetical protein
MISCLLIITVTVRPLDGQEDNCKMCAWANWPCTLNFGNLKNQSRKNNCIEPPRHTGTRDVVPATSRVSLSLLLPPRLRPTNGSELDDLRLVALVSGFTNVGGSDVCVFITAVPT